MARDCFQAGNVRRSHLRVKVIQLRHIVPGKEVGVFSQREINGDLRGAELIEARRVFLIVRLRSLNVILGMRFNPRMIKRSMIPDEIQEKRHISRVEFLAHLVNAIPAADARVGSVLRD